MSRSDRGDRGRWHGEAVTDEGAGFGLGLLYAGGFALRGEFLSQRWERNQRIAGGRLRMDTACPYSPFPGPHYGGYPFEWAKISGAQNRSDWSESPPGHWALSLQKLPPARFHSRAWLCRANAPGPNPGGRMLCAPTGFRWTVGAAISRPPWRFPPPRRGGPTWPPAGGETSLPLTPPSARSPAPDPGTRSHGWHAPRTGPRR